MKLSQDFGAGLFLIALAGVGFVGSLDLSFGRLSSIGPGLMPRSMAVLVGALGLVILLTSFSPTNSPLDRWRLRGPVFVLGAALLFSWTIRPLGLIVAGPLAVIFSSLADRDTRFHEVAIFAVVMTLLCMLLFSDLLSLPIPIDPLGLIPQVVTDAYIAFKSGAKGLIDAVRQSLSPAR